MAKNGYHITRRSVLAAGAASLFMPRLSFAQEGPYVLGTLFPMSGPNAEYGRIYMQAVELAAEHLKADNVLKRPIEVRVEDSQGLPQGGVTGITKLVSVEQAIYVLTGFTGVCKAAAPIAERSKVVLINGGGVGPDLAGLNPYFWNVLPLANIEMRGILPWIQKQGYKRVAAIYVDEPAGNAVVTELGKILPDIGSELVEKFSVPVGAQQFGAIAAKVRETRPDAIYMACTGAQQAQVIKQVRDAGISEPFLGFTNLNIKPIWSLPESEGMVYTTQKSDWESDDPVTKRFVADWATKYGTPPNNFHQNYYNGVYLFALLAKGLEEAGKPVDGDTLREELLRVRKFTLVGGEGEFDDTGTLMMPVQLNQVKDGKVEVIG